MRKTLLLVTVVALTLWGCDADEPTAGNPDESRESRMAPTQEAADHADTAKDCDSFETDLTKEPNYKVDHIHRWTSENGCDVRLDILMTRQWPEHCAHGGGEQVADVLMGTPLGEPHDSSAARIYIKDPTNFLGDEQTANDYDADAVLPEDAVDSGYRQDGAALWITPDDERFIYLVLDDAIERWPQDESPPGCA